MFWKNGTLDVAPLDLLAQALHEVGDFFEHRMDRERTAERFQRMLVVAEFLQDGAETRERTEMARLAREHLVDVGKRVRVVLLGEIDRCAPVPGFDVVGPEVDDGVEQLEREVVVLAVHRGLDAAHQQRTGVAAGGEPERPDAVLDIFRAVRAGRELERLEQLVEIDLGVAALRPRQVWRRLDQLGLSRRRRLVGSLLIGSLVVRRLRQRRHSRGRREHGESNDAWESVSHGQSLRFYHGTAKARFGQYARKMGRNRPLAWAQPWRDLKRFCTLLIT